MLKKTTIVIIDDDQLALDLLKDMLNDYPDMEVVGTALNAEEGRLAVEKYKPDVLYLDIELPDANGVELMQELGSDNPALYIIMFTAVYGDYSHEAFSHYEKDYLLKPIDPKELDKTVQRFRHSTMDLAAIEQPPVIEQGVAERLAVLTLTSEMRILRVSDVGYFRYSTRRKVWEVCLSDHSFITLKKSTRAKDILSYSKNFAQSHQSYIVNMENVMLITQSNVVLYPPYENDEIAVGRIYQKAFQSHFTCI